MPSTVTMKDNLLLSLRLILNRKYRLHQELQKLQRRYVNSKIPFFDRFCWNMVSLIDVWYNIAILLSLISSNVNIPYFHVYNYDVFRLIYNIFNPYNQDIPFVQIIVIHTKHQEINSKAIQHQFLYSKERKI